MVAVSAHIHIESVAFSHLSPSQGVGPARASNQNERYNSKLKLVFSIIDFIIYCLSRCIVIVIVKSYRLFEHSNVIITPL